MNNSDQNNFKNAPQSYWMASTGTTNYPALNEDINVDVAIVGGGLVGISCAYLLKKEGLKIAVISRLRESQLPPTEVGGMAWTG